MESPKLTNDTERTPLFFRHDSMSSARSLTVSLDDASSHSSTVQPCSLQTRALNDEEASFGSTPDMTSSTSVCRMVCVLLIGSFISNADGSLLLATHPIIASEFDALHDSSWLLTSFALTQAATQPLYGKLSDIYGRKSMLLLAYALFAVGCALVGIGASMSTLILGRVVSGAGSSGMTALVSILITDLVPLRDVATWRSYVNVVATTGRSIGGPLGGWLADTIGWRWSFLGQVPLAGIAIILVASTIPSRVQQHHDDASIQGGKLARVDFIGAILMTLSILGLLIPLEIGGDRVPWSSPIITILLFLATVFGALFVATEYWVAKEPIIPLSLLRQRDVVVSSFVMVFQSAAQIGLMFAVPLYFQVTSGASNTVAGAHLFPAVAGNALGGILSGIIINRTGRYKALTLVATVISSTGYLLLVLRWHGNTNWLESLYIFPGGFAMGIVQSALFISVQAAIDPAFSAIATSTLYLASSIGVLAGMSGVSAVLQEALRNGLDNRLTNLGFAELKKWKIIEHALSDVHYSDKAKPVIAKAVVDAYIEALTYTHVLSLACSITAFIGSLFLRQRKL